MISPSHTPEYPGRYRRHDVNQQFIHLTGLQQWEPDGSATVTVSGGTGPYTYQWSNGNTTASVSGVAAGSYSVTVTDQTGCVNNLSVSITEPSAIAFATQVPMGQVFLLRRCSYDRWKSDGLGGTGTLAYL